MASAALTALSQIASVAAGDFMYVVPAAGGTQKKTTALLLNNYLAANLATVAGTAGSFTATAPAASANAQAGVGITLTASDAVDGSSGHAAQNGGNVNLRPGAAVNAGTVGQVSILADVKLDLGSVGIRGHGTTAVQFYDNGGVTRADVLMASNNSILEVDQVVMGYATGDVGLSRLGAASLALGNGAAGSFTGSLKLTTLNIASGGSTTISTGVGSVKMGTANPATNTVWIPIQYAGTTYYVPGWTTNAP